MNSSSAGKKKKNIIKLSSSQTKAALIPALTILYILSFKPITERYGMSIAHMVAIPVVLAGWFFGNRVGLITSLISILLNAVLYTFSLPNGWDLWIRTTWAGNFMVVLVGVIADRLHDFIDKRDLAEAALRTSEAHYRAIVEDQTELICRMLPDGTTTFVNQSYLKFFGKTLEQVIGSSLAERDIDGQSEMIKSSMTLLGPDKPTISIEEYMLNPDGSKRWVQWVDQAIIENGKVIEIQAVGRGITERKQAEDKLIHSERQLSEAQSIAQIGGWEWDILANKTEWSSELYNIFGITPELLAPNAYEGFLNCIHPLDREHVVHVMEQALATQESFSVEYRIVRPDGIERCIHARGQVVSDRSGQSVRMRGSSQDITERKQAEQETMKFYNAVEQSADIIFITDQDGNIEYINPAFEALTNYSKEEIIGKSPRILKSGIMSDEHYQKLWKTILSGEVFRSEIIDRMKDGEIFYYDQTITPIKDAYGNITHFVSTGKDVTERKQAEDNLRKAEAKYRTLVEQIPPIVYIASPHQHIGVTYISPQIKTLGFTEEEWIADPELWLRQIHPDDQARVTEDMERLRQSTKPIKLEYRLRTRDGVIRWFLDEVMDIVDKNGNILFRQGFMLDITEHKQAENEISKRERYFALLNQITLTILASRNSEAIYQTLTHDLAELFEANDCYITRWEEEKQQMIPVASTAQLEHPYSNLHINPGEVMITASVMKSGQVLAVDDVLNSPHINPDLAQQFSSRSVLGIPLIVEEHRYGAAIIAFNTLQHFFPEEIAHAEQVGMQIALALWTVQQEAEIQKHLRESDALTKITRTLSETEQFGLQIVLQLIVTSAKELIPGAQQAVIHLLDEEQQALSPGAVAGFDNPAKGNLKFHINKGVAGQVIVSGETINIADVEKDERFIPYGASPTFRSLMVAPVNSGGKKLGTISVQSGLVSAFTEDENRLLSALGTQAAIAIENAHLLEILQQALKESNALYRINQELVASLDPQELLKDVVGLLQKNFGYYHVQIYVVDPETGDFIMREGSGEIGRQLKERGHRMIAGDGIVGHTAETGTAFFTNNVDDVVFFVRNPLLPEIKSELAVPVKIGGQILGLLDIQQAPPAILTKHDLHLVNAVADQLALALQKANLYSDLQAALQMEKAIRNQMVQNERLVTMGRLLASVSHELNNPLQAIQNALFLLREEKGISLQGQLDLDIVLSEAERMSALIERLRATYRPTQEEDFLPTQINNIIEGVYALISTHLRHNQIVFEFHPDPKLPPIPALADQIRQVILNLLMNAVEAMATGGKLTINTTLLRDSNEILFTVSDTGKGIAPDLLPNIFEAFVTNKQRGTGLGLTISYDIVMKHRGRITAENNPDAGALFKVWLPINNMEIK